MKWPGSGIIMAFKTQTERRSSPDQPGGCEVISRMAGSVDGFVRRSVCPPLLYVCLFVCQIRTPSGTSHARRGGLVCGRCVAPATFTSRRTGIGWEI